jgi:hypothetical protein
LSSDAVGRLDALEDGDEVAALPRAPASRGRSPYGKIRSRLAGLSRGAGERGSDGSAPPLRPYDCRRVFASEHLDERRADALDDDVAAAIEAA